VRYVVGVDLGGTNIAVGTVATDGSALLGYVVRDTPVAAGPDAVVDEIVRLIKESVTAAQREQAGLDVAGVGIGAPGPLNTAQGIVRLAPNLGWHDMPLRDRVSAFPPRSTTTPTARRSANGGWVPRREPGSSSASPSGPAWVAGW